jgi:hypothetical protein
MPNFVALGFSPARLLSLALVVTGLTACAPGATRGLNLPGLNLPGLGVPGYSPGSAVTTNIRDARLTANWLQPILAKEEALKPVPAPSFNLAPGYYQYRLQSYCLHAGTYAPDRGDGYALAPYKGSRVNLVRAILQRSVQHPEVKQQDIQLLLWSIESGSNLNVYEPAFQARVAPVLTPAEILELNAPVGQIIDRLLPDSLREAASFYGSFRGQLVAAQNNFEEVQRLAVLTGIAPRGPGSLDIPEGSWSFDGNGFYVKPLPEGYTRTVLEVLRPAAFSLKRDAQGRITSFESGGYRSEASYDDAPGRGQLSASDTQPIWRFKTLAVHGPVAGQDASAANTSAANTSAANTSAVNVGFVVPPSVTAALPLAAPAGPDGAGWWERAKQLKDIKKWLEEIKQYRETAHRGAQPPSEQAIRDLTDLEHYRDGLQQALKAPNFDRKLLWLGDHLVRVRMAVAYAACALAGDCVPGQNPGEVVPYDPTQNVVEPGNTSKQRLGVSARGF